MDREIIERFRFFLKDSVRQEVDFSATEQGRGRPPPPVEKPWDPDAVRVNLPGPNRWPNVKKLALDQAIRDRESCRVFSPTPLQLDELSFLLWASERSQMRRSLRSQPCPPA